MSQDMKDAIALLATITLIIIAITITATACKLVLGE